MAIELYRCHTIVGWCTGVHCGKFMAIELYRSIQFHNVLTNTIYKLYGNYGRQVYYVKIGEKILVCNPFVSIWKGGWSAAVLTKSKLMPRKGQITPLLCKGAIIFYREGGRLFVMAGHPSRLSIASIEIRFSPFSEASTYFWWALYINWHIQDHDFCSYGQNWWQFILKMYENTYMCISPSSWFSEGDCIQYFSFCCVCVQMELNLKGNTCIVKTPSINAQCRSMSINADQNHGIDPKCLSMSIIADQCRWILINANQCRSMPINAGSMPDQCRILFKGISFRNWWWLV